MSEAAPGDRYQEPLQVLEGPPPRVSRRIVVWRRIEPGDVRTTGALEVPESPFLEARTLEIAIPAEVHRRMRELAAIKTRITALPRSPWIEYEPAGVLLAASGALAAGTWLEYLRPERIFSIASAITLVAGVALAVVSKQRRRAVEAEIAARWEKASERGAYQQLAIDLARGWLRVSSEIRRDLGFHTEIRVAEGSPDPLRLASIDPRPFQGAAGFDPEDWLPTEGGAVRYEALHAGGEIATRILPGASEVEREEELVPDPSVTPSPRT
jgi:hypothetical protein